MLDSKPWLKGLAGLVYTYARICAQGRGTKEEEWLEHLGVCAPEASLLPNFWKRKTGGKNLVGFDESFMHVVQTCHGDVKSHQLS